MKVFRQRQWRSAKADALGFRRRDTLRLSLTDIGALILRHKGQHLQDNIAEEGSHQVLAPAGVQQRHIQYHDVDAFFFREDAPLFQNLAIIPSQPVDALDVEQIARLEFFHQLLVLGAVKVLAGLLVHKDVLLRNRHFTQCDQLAILVLFPGADPDVAVNI